MSEIRVDTISEKTSTSGVTIDSLAIKDGSLSCAAGAALSIDSTGAVTKPLQPAFMAMPSGVQSNVADLTVLEFATEVFDQNADWNNSSHTFTAPITGRYQVSAIVRIDNHDQDGSYFAMHVATSNRDYYNLWGTAQFDADATYHPFVISLLVDMDASDTLQFKYAENSSATAQADVSTSSYVSVYLVC